MSALLVAMAALTPGHPRVIASTVVKLVYFAHSLPRGVFESDWNECLRRITLLFWSIGPFLASGDLHKECESMCD